MLCCSSVIFLKLFVGIEKLSVDDMLTING